MSLHSTISEAFKMLETFRGHYNEFLSLLRNQPALAEWDSVERVANNLRRMLFLRKRLAMMRERIELMGNATYRALSAYKDSIIPVSSSYEIARHSGGGFGNSWAESEKVKKTAQLLSKGPGNDDYLVMKRILNETKQAFQTIEEQYRELERTIFRKLPNYIDIKKVMPIGGRDAYSILLACDIGKKDSTLASQHSVLGWYFQPNEETIAWFARAIKPVREIGGKAPSIKRGRELLRSYPQSRYPQVKTPKNREVLAYEVMSKRYHSFNDTEKRSFIGRDSLTVSDMSGTFALTFLRRWEELECYRHGRLWRVLTDKAEKITGYEYSSNVPTLLTSDPQQLQDVANGEGVFYAKCYYVDIEPPTSRNGWKRVAIMREGYIASKLGWNGDYHFSDIDYVNYISIQAYPKMSFAEFVAIKVNDASRYFFQQVERNKLYLQNEKKEKANALRCLRKIDTVTLADSFAVGNCKPGTMAFCAQLGIDVESIDGKKLALAWKRQHYPQPSRFIPVIKRLCDQARTLQTTSEA